jgi:hypothetical protein
MARKPARCSKGARPVKRLSKLGMFKPMATPNKVAGRKSHPTDGIKGTRDREIGKMKKAQRIRFRGANRPANFSSWVEVTAVAIEELDMITPIKAADAPKARSNRSGKKVSIAPNKRIKVITLTTKSPATSRRATFRQIPPRY